MTALETDRPEMFRTLETVVLRAPESLRPGLLKDLAARLPAAAATVTASVRERSGDRTGAVEALSRLSETPTSSVALLLAAADSARRLKELAQAEKLLRRVLAISPGHDRAVVELANALSGQQRPREAESLLSVSMTPPRFPSPEVVNALAWLRATSADPDVRDGADAEQLVRDAIEAAGGPNCFMLSTLAAAQAEQSRFDEAVRTIEQAVALAKRDGATGAVPQFEAYARSYREKKRLTVR